MEARNATQTEDKDLVLVFSGAGANDAIAGLMADYAAALREAGLSVIQLTFDQGELNYAVDLMSKGKVLFAMTWLGIGQTLEVRAQESGATFNAFEIYQVPLVKLQGDSPAYFIDFHRDTPRNAVNLYQAKEFLEFRRRWLPGAQAITGSLPPMPMVPCDRSAANLAARRSGRLFFVKNGNSAAALEALWAARVPSRTARTLTEMAHSLGIGCVGAAPLHIGDWIEAYLSETGVAPPIPPKLVWFFAAQLDDYLRRVKSTLIAEALLDFPVVVQGAFWDHVDFRGRRAQLAPPMDVFKSQQIVLNELGVIDMSANVDSWPHDRVQRAAGSYSMVLTNRQQWLSDRFPDFVDLTFEFDRESIAERVSNVLDHRDRYIDMAVAFGDRFREIFPRTGFAETVLRLVDHARWIWINPRPPLQDFFVWTAAE